MQGRALSLSLSIAGLYAAGCSGLPVSPCGAGEQPAVRESLYFGTDTPDGPMSAGAWSDFLAQVVTPRCPEGLTAWPASGQWRTADGRVVSEASHVLVLLRPAGAGEAAAAASIVAIVEADKARFRQEAVLRVRAPACMGF